MIVQGLPSLDDLDTAAHAALPTRVILQQWRRLSPVLQGPGIRLRELQLSDAPSLAAMLEPGDVGSLVSSPPVTILQWVGLVERAQEDRARGESITLGLVPEGYGSPIGIFHVRQMEPKFGSAAWSFALGRPFWGAGVFFAGAPVFIDFVFDVLSARRLEARVSVRNGRGNGALRKLGAVQEALVRGAVMEQGEPVDQVLWAIVADEWRTRRPSSFGPVH
jgi:RimJ/RimL family protein N-acetyltransferase